MSLALPLVALPVAVSAAEEPPAPAPAARPDVDVEGQARRYAEPIRRIRDSDPLPAEDAKPTAEPDKAAEAQPDEAKPSEAKSTEERGIRRAALLRKLEGGEVVTLEADPSYPPTVTEPLELVEAVAFALKNNFEIAAAKAKTEGSQWDLVGGFGQYLPRVDYNRKQGHEHSRPTSYHDPSGATVPSDRHPYWSRDISVRQPVIDLSIVADILARWDGKDAVKAEELGVRERVALDTINSFMRLAQSRLLINFATRYKEALDKLAQRMGDRVAGGGASAVELERVNARATSAQSAMIEARAEFKAAMTEFRRLTGQTPQKLTLPANLLPTIPDNVDEVVARALRFNPDYLAALLRIDQTRENAAKAFAGPLPKFAIEISDSRSWNSGGVTQELPGNAPGGVFPYSNTKKIMGVMSMQLNGGVDFAQGMAYAAQTRQVTAQAADTRARLEESVRTGYSALSAANGRIEAVSTAMEANGKVAGVFEEQYLSGGRQLLDLLDAYERLYQSQTELSRLVVSEASATFLVRRQMGELVKALMLGGEE